MRRASRCTVAAAALLAACGCSVSSRHEPMTVAVRDKLTRQPIAGARVHARSVNFYVPAGYAFNKELFGEADPILGASPPSAEGVTDYDGTVRFPEIVVNHPVQLVVVAAGYEPQVLHMERHPALTGEPSAWLDADPGPGSPYEALRVEVRVMP